MKQKYFLGLLFATGIFLNVSAQNNGINYKAIIKDDLGNVIANDLIEVEFTILQGAGETNVYKEVHSPSSDANGIIILNIGEGTPISGVFTGIEWGDEVHFLNTKINTGAGLVDMGTTAFNYVPYAKHAESASFSKNNWGTAGNSGLDAATNFIGTSDEVDLVFKRNNENAGLISNQNTAFGLGTLISNTGIYNTATGSDALRNNTTGSYNSAVGRKALVTNTTGFENTALGYFSLFSNTTGSANAAIGSFALAANTTGGLNTATGVNALRYNTIGSKNTANGLEALYSNTSGSDNIASGFSALVNNTTGSRNSAFGTDALYSNKANIGITAVGYRAMYYADNRTTGIETYNTAIGYEALRGSTSVANNIGTQNTANGYQSLFSNSSGRNNTANGAFALYFNTTGQDNTAQGTYALSFNTTGQKNTALGFYALSNNNTGSNNLGVGYNAQVPSATGSNQVRIGNTNISYAGIQVGWTITSDQRWKDYIRKLPYGLDMLMQLKPVDYIRKNNEHQTREIGFIAQDLKILLEAVGYQDQGLLTADDDGFMSVRYNDFIPLIVKAVQEQQATIQSLKVEVALLKELVSKVENLEQQFSTLNNSN